MAAVTIYTTRYCPYCHAAKDLLTRKKIAFSEIDVTSDPARRDEMTKRAGRYTVPQIWVGDVHVGGCDDLYDLDRQGGLDPLLAA